MASYFLLSGNSAQNINPIHVEKYISSACKILRFEEDVDEAMRILDSMTDVDISTGALEKYEVDLKPKVLEQSEAGPEKVSVFSLARNRAFSTADLDLLQQDIQSQIITRKD